jgi:hypothetical protein
MGLRLGGGRGYDSRTDLGRTRPYTPVEFTPPAATYWLASAGAGNDANAGTYASAWSTLAHARTVMAPGDTLGLKDGTYTEAWSALPAGSANTWCHVVAETEGAVTMTGGLSAATTGNWYCTVTGSNFSNAVQKSITGSYFKFVRCGFRGAQSTGNISTIVAGTGDQSPGADHGLFEDCWAYGPGGRYKFLVYNATNMLLRRCVARHDGGWTWDGSNPQAGIALYDSACVAQQCVVIDSPAGLAAHEGELYMPYNNNEGNAYMSVNALGCFVIQAQSSGIKIETAGAFPKQTDVTHSVVHCTANGRGVVNNAPNSVMAADRCTVIDGIDGYAAYQQGSVLSVTGSLVEDADDAINGATVVGTNNRGWNNAGGDDGLTQLDPEANGLTYPMRLESGSTLVAIPCGANLTLQVGTPGALVGESGWNTITATPLWPWSTESRMHTEMSSVSSRGFAAPDQTFTGYIANLLGNGNPY